jgi:hypothetical protein
MSSCDTPPGLVMGRHSAVSWEDWTMNGKCHRRLFGDMSVSKSTEECFKQRNRSVVRTDSKINMENRELPKATLMVHWSLTESNSLGQAYMDKGGFCPVQMCAWLSFHVT